MPRVGTAYSIDNEWKQQVEACISEMGISHAAFARLIKCSKASLSEALGPESKQTTLAPVIHKALRWPPPRSILMSPDEREMWRALDGLDPRDRAAVIERAIMLREARNRR